jgi:hypothetical protein
MSYDLEYGKYRDKPLAFLRDNDPDYKDAVYLKTKWPKSFDLVKSTSYDESYHAGGPEDQANYEYWKENYASTQGKSWWDLGHADGIFVRIPLLSKDERESYEYLEDNFELDEDATQKIRSELEMKAWDDYGSSDYKKALKESLEDEEDKEIVEELLDAITDGAFGAAVFDMWSRSGHYPETSGWEVTFPNPKNLFEHDDNLSGWDLQGVIDWLGIGHEVTVRLSPDAFCRLDPEDREFSYPGAVYTRYGEEWVLNITLDEIVASIPELWPTPERSQGWRGAPIDFLKLEELLQMHLDESARYQGVDQAPSVTMMYNSALCKSRYLTCAIDYVEASKLRILGGPSSAWTEEHHITDEELKDQREFEEKVEAIRILAIDGALEVCGIDPANDLVEQVVEQLLLDAPERSAFTLSQPSTRQHLKEVACEITRGLLEKRPPICTIRQLKLPHVAERSRKRKRA